MPRSALLGALLLVSAACADQQGGPAETSQETRFERVSGNPVEHGRRLSLVLGCSGCHNDTLLGRDWSEPEYGTLWTANLTRSADLHSDEELIAMIVTGRKGDRPLYEMPSYLFGEIHSEDMAALLSYIRSLPVTGDVHPEPTIGPALAVEIASGEYRNSEQRVAEAKGTILADFGPDTALGRHIARATCAECHGIDLRGREQSMAEGGNPPPDLRIAASYDEAGFAEFMRSGKAAGNRDVNVMSMVARNRYSSLTATEVQALHQYLIELARSDP